MKPVERDVKKDAALGRRDLMKLGAGAAVMATVGAGPSGSVAAQESSGSGAARPQLPLVSTGPGYKNNANRLSGNGPMDATTRQLVEYTASFSESAFKDNMVRANWTMLDTLVAHMAGFESEPARICAQMGSMRPASDKMKSTIMGYGVTTSPEMAAFANAFMVRQTDYNDSTPGLGHASTIIPGILAVGEAVHSTGLEVLVAIGLGYEILHGLQAAGRIGPNRAGGGWDGPYDSIAVALACGKLLKLDEDRLANALSLAFVPHLPMSVTHVGALSHWKAGHESMAVSCAVFAALMAKQGMTGPAQPFEQRSGWFEHDAPFRQLRLPVNQDGSLGIEHTRMKEYPAEGSTQGFLDIIPSIREWTKVDEIESIHVENALWDEVADPPKWDPRNRETADHSLPFLIAIALTDGEVYLDAFKPERYLHDAAIRDLMNRMTISEITDLKGTPSIDGSTSGDEQGRLTIKKKTGEVLVKESRGYHNPTSDDVIAKFNRVCTYRSVSNAQRDRAMKTWPNLRTVKDIGDPIRDLANYGKPLPL